MLSLFNLRIRVLYGTYCCSSVDSLGIISPIRLANMCLGVGGGGSLIVGLKCGLSLVLNSSSHASLMMCAGDGQCSVVYTRHASFSVGPEQPETI